MRKISEILYKKFRPAVFIKWGLGRNSTSSALTRLAQKNYLASSWILEKNCGFVFVFVKHTMWTICGEKLCHLWPHTWYLLDLRLSEEKCSQGKFMPGGEQIGLEHLAISIILWSPCFFPSCWCKYDHLT